MATTTQISALARITSPLALWHLLSLDAPTVATLWTYFVARASHTAIPFALPAAMFLAVWILYAADRLLDTRQHASVLRRGRFSELELRHIFHFQHRRTFLTIIPLAAIAVMALLPNLLTATIHLYLIEGVVLVGWFCLVHTTRSRLPKEVVVGLYFAASTFTPTLVRRTQPTPALLMEAALFASVCTLNCLFIHAWEHDRSAPRNHLTAAALVLTVASIAAGLREPVPAVSAAAALAATSLLVVHALRRSFSRTHLRAAADLALLTPALILPFLK